MNPQQGEENWFPDELWVERGVSARIREVLEAHRLEAGSGYYAGHIVCTGCECVPGDVMEHLHGVLAAALDPFHSALRSTESDETPKPDRRESQTRWEAS